MASPLLAQVSSLESARAALETNPSAAGDWQVAEVAARTIADTLRTRSGEVDHKTQLGESSLPRTIAGLFQIAATSAGEAGIPSSTAAKTAVYELLRVGANVCSDHNPNRQALLDAGVVASVLEMLDAYWRKISATDSSRLPVDDLRLIKTCIGILLNASLGYEPIRSTLVSSKAPLTILQLSSTLYAPGGWVHGDVEEWKWRSGLSSWGWTAISNFKGDDSEDDGPTQASQNDGKQPPIFDAEALPFLVTALSAFIPKLPPQEPPTLDRSTCHDFVRSDLDVLNHVSTQLESLALDSQTVRCDLAGWDIMTTVVDFVE
ncbi:hypothetical protein FRC00_013382, partial [Tulasnella sp. 408]